MAARVGNKGISVGREYFERIDMKDMIIRNMKALRRAAGWKKEELARVLGIAHEEYAVYEDGKHEMPLRVMERVADVFGVELAALFADDNKAVEEMIIVPVVGMTDADVREVMRFEQIVKQYRKMRRMMLTE